MTLLDENKIKKLGEVFKQYQKGIEKVLFIAKMKQELSKNIKNIFDETNLVYGLFKFFKEIDFNDDKHM